MKPFDNSKMFPKFTFLKEIGPDFYLNLRSYEETFTLVNLRYFFHRYQELINHTLSVGQIFEKGYSETILERKYMYGGVPYTKSSFEKDDDRTVMNLEGKSR